MSVVHLALPPLRQREGDVALLAQHFIDRLNEVGQKKVQGLAKATLDQLEPYAWPGNVRELQNAAAPSLTSPVRQRRAVAFSRHSRQLGRATLPAGCTSIVIAPGRQSVFFPTSQSLA